MKEPGTSSSTTIDTPAKTDPLATDKKPDDKSLLNKDGKPDDKAPAGAPKDGYADFTLPDGVTLDPEGMNKAKELFQGMNLSQDQAQSMVAFHLDQMAKAAAQPMEQYNAMRTKWQTAAKSDPDLGDGKQIKDSVRADIAKAYEALGNPELVKDFKAAMDLTGVGDNPAFIKTFWKMAQVFIEGKAIIPGGPSKLGQTAPDAKPVTAARAMYPNLASGA